MRLILFLVFALFLASCTSVPATDFCGSSSSSACSSDVECVTGGCSSQVCQGSNEPLELSTCEWQDCYDAEAYGLDCGCVEQQCQWS